MKTRFSKRQITPDNFWICYSRICNENKLCPSRGIHKYLKGAELNISYYNLPPDYWLILLKTISDDNYLTAISLSHAHINQKSVVVKSANAHHERIRRARLKPKISEVQVGDYLASCIRNSQVLRTLNLEYYPLSSSDINLLCDALQNTTGLKELSFKGSLNHYGVIAVCQSLKKNVEIEWINFSDCFLSLAGIQALVNLIQYQADERFSKIWELSLRYQMPNLDSLKGIRRITLNNVELGDMGAITLATILASDLWIKVLDLQNCNIGNKGATFFKQVLNVNCILEILDLRQNSFFDGIQRQILEILQSNNDGKILKYPWIPSLK